MICTINDIEKVNRVLKHPDVYNCISDDGSPKRKDFTAELLLKSGIPVIMPNEETVFIYIPHNSVTYDIHITTTPEARGQRAVEASKKALFYAFKKLKCEKLICFIPEIYNNVLKFTLQMGFKQEGYLVKSYKKNNILYDEYICGLRRDEWEQRQQ